MAVSEFLHGLVCGAGYVGSGDSCLPCNCIKVSFAVKAVPREIMKEGRPADNSGCKHACPIECGIKLSEFVHVFRAVFKRVFRGGKICLRYFKIGQTYFEICALYFLFAPMWVKCAENMGRKTKRFFCGMGKCGARCLLTKRYGKREIKTE